MSERKPEHIQDIDDGPPVLYDDVAECALLGAALLDYRVLSSVDVQPGAFSLVSRRALWATGQDLAQQGIQVDEVTLPLDVLDAIGGAPGILELINSCPSVTRAGDYARIVREKSEQRQTLDLAERLARAAHRPHDERVVQVRETMALSKNLVNSVTTAGAWRTYTLTDAYAPRDPLVYVVDDLFSLPSLSIVYGSPGCLKSMLMADMALCVAGGIPWLPSPPDQVGVPPRKTVAVPVLWIDFDNGTRRTHERIEALGRAHNLDPEMTPFYYVSMPTPWLDANDDESMNSLIRMVNVLNAGLVIVDNLGVVSGDADENSAQMVQVLSNFRLLSEETGAAVVVVHHQRKTTGYSARTGESLRGHSSIEAALDLALLVQREDGAKNVKIQSTKTRGTDVYPFGALFSYEHRPGTKELLRARFYGLPMIDNRKPARARRAILEVIGEAEKSPNKKTLVMLAQEVYSDIGVIYYRNTIDMLVDSKEITETSGSNYSKHYSLSSLEL